MLSEKLEKKLKKSKNFEKYQKYLNKLNYFEIKLKNFIYNFPILKYWHPLYLWIKIRYKDGLFFIGDIILNGIILYFVIVGYYHSWIPTIIVNILRWGMGIYIITYYIREAHRAHVKAKTEPKEYLRGN